MGASNPINRITLAGKVKAVLRMASVHISLNTSPACRFPLMGMAGSDPIFNPPLRTHVVILAVLMNQLCPGKCGNHVSIQTRQRVFVR